METIETLLNQLMFRQVEENYDLLLKKFDAGQNHFAALFGAIPAGLSIATDPSCKEIRHNPVAAKFLRLELRDSLSHSAPELPPVKLYHKGKKLSPDEMPLQCAAWYGDSVSEFEIEFVWEDGVCKTAVWSSSPLYDDKGFIIGAVATFQDITQPKRLKADLDKKVAALKCIFEQTPVGIALLDTELRYSQVNDHCARITGHSPQDLVGLSLENNLRAHFGPEAANEMIAHFQHCLQTGDKYVLRDWYSPRLSSEEPFFADWEIQAVSGYEGKPLGILLSIVDITQHVLNNRAIQRMQEELQKQNEHLNRLVAERTTKLEEANNLLKQEIASRTEAEENLRESKEELSTILDSITDAFYALDSNWQFTYINKAAEVLMPRNAHGGFIGRNIWEEFPDAVGSAVYDNHCKAMYDKVTVRCETNGIDGNGCFEMHLSPFRDGISVFFRDIVERKQAEDKMRLLEERFCKTFMASPNLMSLRSLQDGRYIDVNESWLRCTGFERDEVVGQALDDFIVADTPQGIDEFTKRIREGLIHDLEVEYRTKSGAIRIGVLSTEIVEINEEKCILDVMRDITKRKQVDKEMARLERLNFIGQMAASIGHEVRNPMTTVRGFLQLLKDKPECSNYYGYFDLMLEELDRANSIISQFLSLAKNKTVELKMQNLNTVIRNLLPLLQADAIVSDKHITPELNEVPDISLDEKEIRHLILNLVRNGLEAMRPGGQINIRTSFSGQEVVLAVQDNGVGIQRDVLDKIGTPFLTTKDTGTGLGLAICYSIAARHNAAIEVKTGSTGTTVFVRFKTV